MVTRLALSAVVVGIAADRRVGEPPAASHPVAAFGRAMTAVEGLLWRDRRPAGVAYTVIGVGTAALCGRLASGRGRPVRVWVAVAVSTWVVVAGRGLGLAAASVGDPLRGGDLELARHRLPALVGRDPHQLDEAGIVRAVVESVAENTVDAVVAPALWATVAGAPGALGYRAANTLDSMVGHHSERYEQFGWASARLDDVANWVPARVCAALVVAVRPRRAAAIWRAVRADAPAHPSPNAGVAEAAFAAALDVRLGGTNTYGERIEVRAPLGDGRAPEVTDIARAVRLGRDVGTALALALAALASLAGPVTQVVLAGPVAQAGFGARR